MPQHDRGSHSLHLLTYAFVMLSRIKSTNQVYHKINKPSRNVILNFWSDIHWNAMVNFSSTSTYFYPTLKQEAQKTRNKEIEK